jgi:sulfur carrier protein ThiS
LCNKEEKTVDYNWITSPLAVYAVVAAGSAAALHLVASTKIEMSRQQKRHLADTQSLRDAMAALESKVQQVCVEVNEKMVPPAPSAPFKGLNVYKRAEALRMYRHGSDSHSVSTALGLPQAEVALLQKVQHLLSGSAA